MIRLSNRNKFREMNCVIISILIYSLVFSGFWVDKVFASKATQEKQSTKLSKNSKETSPQKTDDKIQAESAQLNKKEKQKKSPKQDKKEAATEEKSRSVDYSNVMDTSIGKQSVFGFELDPKAGVSGGIVDLKADLFTGAATMSIPFGPIPPGRTGLTPQVSINYNSNNGNGYLGAGWDINYSGYIGRSTKDGQIDYADPKFEYSFDGTSGELVETIDGYYFPEINTDFTRFYYDQTNNLWIVKKRNGMVYAFGVSARQYSSSLGTAKWFLDYIIDPSGNFIKFEYEGGTTEAVYLRYIKYTGHMDISSGITAAKLKNPTITLSPKKYIEFITESRDDQFYGYRYGFKIQRTKRLDKIKTYYYDKNGASINVTQFDLVYASTNTSESSKSRLTKIQRKGSSDGTNFDVSLPDITFSYDSYNGSGTNYWTSNSNYIPSISKLPWGLGGYRAEFGEFNGDGLTDIGDGAYCSDSCDGDDDAGYILHNKPTSTSNSWQTTAGRYFPAFLTEPVSGGTAGNDSTHTYKMVKVVDLNGDGLDDVYLPEVWSRGNSADYKIFDEKVWLNNNGSSWDETTDKWKIFRDKKLTNWDGEAGNYDNFFDIRFADFNGDGLADLYLQKMVLDVSSTPYVQSSTAKIYRNTGSSWEEYIKLSSYNFQTLKWIDGPNGLEVVDLGAQFIDLNGDGLTDILMADASQTSNKALINNGQGGFVDETSQWALEGYNMEFTYKVTDNDGDYAYQDHGVRIVDINSDGLPDLVRKRDPDGNGDQGGDGTTLINKGNGWVSKGNNFEPPYGFTDTDGKDKKWRFIDLNNDGYQDLLQYNHNCNIGDTCTEEKKAYLNNFYSSPKDFLTSVNNGIGLTLNITYEREYGQASNPEQTGYMPFGKFVVKEIEYTDSVTGKNFSTSYDYSNPYYNYQDKEFRGFGTVTETENNGDQNISKFYQGIIGASKDIEKSKVLAGKLYYYKGAQSSKSRGTKSTPDSYVEITNTWQFEYAPQDYGRFIFPYLEETQEIIVDRDENGSETYEQKNQKFFYNFEGQDDFSPDVHFGTITEIQHLGRPETEEDDFIETNIYATPLNINTYYIADRIIRKKISTAGGDILRYIHYYYDDRSDGYVDKRGLVTLKKAYLDEPPGYVTTEYEYDAYGNIDWIKDAKGSKTDITWDNYTYTYPVEITNQLAHKRLIGFDERFGKVNSVTDWCKNDCETITPKTFTYNAFGQLETISDSIGKVADYTYYWTSTPVKIKEDLNEDYDNNSALFTTVRFYDGQLREYAAKKEATVNGTDGQLVFNAKEYDYKGRITKAYLPYFTTTGSITDAPSLSTIASNSPGYTENTYDRLNRIIHIDFPDGTEKSHSFKSTDEGYQETIKDANYIASENGTNGDIIWKGKKKIIYDTQGNIIKVIEYKGLETYETNYKYNVLGELTKVSRNNGINIFKTTYKYDTLGRLIEKNDGKDIFGAIYFFYDDNGNLTQISRGSPEAVYVTNSYDELNRLTEKDYTSSKDIDIFYSYDGTSIGRISLIYNEGNQFYKYFTYDSEGRIESKIHGLKSVMDNKWALFKEIPTYDPLGRIHNSVIKTSVDSNSETIANTNYEFDSGANLKKVTDANASIESLLYNSNGQIKGINYGNQVKTTYEYNADNLRLESTKTSPVSQPDNYLQNLSYAYDYVGNLMGITEGSNSQEFKYDDLYRLIYSKQNYGSDEKELSYQYDSSGNMKSNTQMGSYTYNTIHPYKLTDTSLGGSYSYDDYGRITKYYDYTDNQKNKTFEYDSEDRVVSIQKASGQLGISFMYDESGLRVRKTIQQDENPIEEVLYFLDGKTELSKNSIQDTLTVYHYANGDKFAKTTIPVDRNKLSNEFTESSFNPESLLQKPDVPPVVIKNGATYYFHKDHLGSTDVITDEGGNIVESLEYYPYGLALSDSNSNITTDKYTGQKWDDEIALYYYGARYYDPQICRFISPDPAMKFGMPASYIADPQLQNPYAYARNNPMKYVDPTGGEPKPTLVLFFGGYNSNNSGSEYQEFRNNIESKLANTGANQWRPYYQGRLGPILNATFDTTYFVSDDIVKQSVAKAVTFYQKTGGDVLLGSHSAGSYAHKLIYDILKEKGIPVVLNVTADPIASDDELPPNTEVYISATQDGGGKAANWSLFRKNTATGEIIGGTTHSSVADLVPEKMKNFISGMADEEKSGPAQTFTQSYTNTFQDNTMPGPLDHDLDL